MLKIATRNILTNYDYEKLLLMKKSDIKLFFKVNTKLTHTHTKLNI